MLANRFRSGRVPHQHIGISSFTDDKLVLDVIGNANISNDLTVGGDLNAPSIIVSGSAPAQFDDVRARNLRISGIATFLNNVSIGGTLTYEDVTSIDSIGIITARSGITLLDGNISVGGTIGKDAQYLRSTGIGVTWSDFPTLRTEQSFIATAGQTSFSYQYNVGFLDVFYNGVKLIPGNEYIADNGTSVILLSPAFEGDIVEVIAYNTVTTGGGGSGNSGGGGSTRVSVGNTAPTSGQNGDLWWKSNEGNLKIYYTDVDGSQWVDASAGGGGGGSVSYTLPIATDIVLGGVKVGTGLTITAGGLLSATGSGGNGSSTLEGLTDTTISSPQNGQVLKYVTGTGWVNDSASGGLSDIISDITPQLGGDLDVNGKRIVTTANSHILFQPNGNGKIGIGNVTVPYSLFHVKGSYPVITVQKTGALDDAAIQFRDNNGLVGAGISQVSDGNNLVFNVLDTERLRVTSSGLQVTGISTFNGNVDINGSLDVSGSIGGSSYISHPHGTTETIIVKVIDKTSNHRYFGDGSAKGYTLNGVESPVLSLVPGRTYRFNQDDGSNASHQLRFYLDVGKQFLFSDGVTYSGNGTGNVGDYTEIEVTEDTPIGLHYQCVNHPKMGNYVHCGTNHIDTNLDGTFNRGLSVSGISTFGGTVDAQGILQALTLVSESTTPNSVFYAGNGGQLLGGSNVTYDGNSFKVNDKNFTVNNGHSQFNTVNVSGIATVVGVGTFKDNVYIDNDCYVGNELWVKGIKVTSGDENDPPSYGEDINTRNLRSTGISTFVGVSSFVSGVDFSSTTFFRSNQPAYFGGTPLNQGGNGGDAKLSINGNSNGNAYITAGGSTNDGTVYLRTSELLVENKSSGNPGIVTVRDSGVTVAGIVTANSFEGDGSNLVLGSINTLSDVSVASPQNGQVLKFNDFTNQWEAAADQTGSGGSGGSETIISPVAYAVVNSNSAGSGLGMSWGAYNTGTYRMEFTFDTAQPDANYYVHTNREHYATHNIEVFGKTTTGFTTKWTNSDGSDLDPATFGGVLIVYASTPTKDVGAGLGDISVTTNSAGTNALSYNATTGVFTFTPYLLPTATASDVGAVKVDGTTITINNGVISSSATSTLEGLTDTNVTAPISGHIIQHNGTKWINVPLSDSTGIPRYATIGSFPDPAASEGQIGYNNVNNSIYVSDGTTFSSNRIVTTNSSVSSDLSTLIGDLTRTYTFGTSDYNQSGSTYSAARKRIKLTDDDTVPNVTEFILHAGTGLSISKTTNASSEDEIGLAVTGDNYSITSVSSAGPADSILRLTDSISSETSDIILKGAGGLVVSQAAANEFTFTIPSFPEEYTDNKAKAAAGAALQNGTHTGITFQYDDVNKKINAEVTATGNSTDTKYDLTGTSLTSNSAKINLIPEQGGGDTTTNTIEIVGSVRTTNTSSGTVVSWDNTNKKIDISSPAVNIPDWNVDGGTTANPTGNAGGILNKPSLSDVGQTGKLSDSTDLKNTSANDNDRLKYVSSTQKWTPTTNNIADLTNVSSATPAEGDVLKWDNTAQIWKPQVDQSGSGGSSSFRGLDDTPAEFTGQQGKYVRVNTAENALEFAETAGSSTIEDKDGTSSSIADDAYGTLDITDAYFKAFTLFKIKPSVASWVRIYCDSTSRTNDASRSWGNDPLPGSGVIAEVTTTTSDQEVLVTPGVFGFNNDSPREGKIYLAINNRSGSASTVTVTLTVLKIGD